MNVTYTQDQLDIALLKQKNEDFYRCLDRLDRAMDKMEGNQKWILGLVGAGFIGLLGLMGGLLGLMAHGFKWII